MRLQMCVVLLAALASAGCGSSDKAASARRRNVMPAPKGAWLAPDEAAGDDDDEFGMFEEELEEEKVKISDPLKGFNRAMHNFNDRLYFSVLKPFAKACKNAYWT